MKQDQIPSAATAVANAQVVIFDLFHTLASFVSDGTPGPTTSEILGIPESEWNQLLWDSASHRLTATLDDDFTVIQKLAHRHDPSISSSLIRQAAQSRAERFCRCLTEPSEDRVNTIKQLVAMDKKLVLLRQRGRDGMSLLG